MKNYLILAMLSWVAINAFSSDAHALFKSTKVTLTVVDEGGRPLEGVDAGIGFEKNTGWGTDATAQRGLTDGEGRFTATGSCNGHIGYGARKEGYYRSHYDYDFKDLGSFGWEPWNPELKIVMRKIEKPVPMYARDTKMAQKKVEVPIVGKDVGFDLIVYDWVAPYGKGKYADFIFHLERRVVDRMNFDATLTVTFSNDHDGIQQYRENPKNGSQFKLPRLAPQTGYENKLVLHEWRYPSDNKVNRNFNFYASDINYIFRVRSHKKDKNTVEAIYGKILGSFRFDSVFSSTAKIYFKYYLNPDHTRNLEFDPQRNLFGNLSDLERVTEP